MPQLKTNHRFLDAIHQRVIIYDGAMGTSLQALRLTPQHFGGESYNGCNDVLVLTAPDVVEHGVEGLPVAVDVAQDQVAHAAPDTSAATRSATSAGVSDPSSARVQVAAR